MLCSCLLTFSLGAALANQDGATHTFIDETEAQYEAVMEDLEKGSRMSPLTPDDVEYLAELQAKKNAEEQSTADVSKDGTPAVPTVKAKVDGRVSPLFFPLIITASSPSHSTLVIHINKPQFSRQLWLTTAEPIS